MGCQDCLVEPALPVIHYRISGRMYPPQGDVDVPEASLDEPRYPLHLPGPLSLGG